MPNCIFFSANMWRTLLLMHWRTSNKKTVLATPALFWLTYSHVMRDASGHLVDSSNKMFVWVVIVGDNFLFPTIATQFFWPCILLQSHCLLKIDITCELGLTQRTKHLVTVRTGQGKIGIPLLHWCICKTYRREATNFLHPAKFLPSLVFALACAEISFTIEQESPLHQIIGAQRRRSANEYSIILLNTSCSL